MFDLASVIPAAAVAALVTLVGTLLSFREQKKKLEHELAFQRTKLEGELQAQRARLEADFATEISAEGAIRHLLQLTELPYRSFPMIRHHIGGFEANELRKLLVRAGAVRFMAADGTELWALRDRVIDDFRRSRWKHDESPRNKVPEDHLFPRAFEDPENF